MRRAEEPPDLARARKAVDASDSDIAKAVRARLSKDSQLKTVDVRTDAGVVTLTGRVPTIGASAKVPNVARGVRERMV